MMKKLVLTTGLAVFAAASTSAFAGGECGGPSTGDQNLNELSPFYYDSDAVGDAAATTSGIPHLPAYYGHMATNQTNRFFNVNEQTATMIGEGKHGLWRTQDNGTVREYLTADAKLASAGLVDGSDPLDPANLASIQNNYSFSDADDSWAGYVADGNQVNADGNLAYVDLPISHAKYAGKYSTHVPIDLPSWYCTMSGPEYKNAAAAVRFAFGQEGANVVGPLGKRAGLDIKENYTNVLRMQQFPDARMWVNTSGDTDIIDYQAINTDAKNSLPYEIYLIERPFFNEEYLFVTVVFADKSKNSKNFSYIRPDGAYYDHLMARKAGGEKMKFRTKLRHAPKFRIAKKDDAGNWRTGRYMQAATSMSGYGVHHPGDEPVYEGGCPAMGGDWGAAYFGGSWPTAYQEVTPLCDAVMIDIKLFANLAGGTWNDRGAYLANATIEGAQNSGDLDSDGSALTRGQKEGMTGRDYGNFAHPAADPYLADTVNPERYTARDSVTQTYQFANDAVTYEPSLDLLPSQVAVP
ncbi:MAG: hypothetical protein V7745_00505 [Pseudomonadales bacterium]